jgi:divalent metal cation (Fe/Co/Zn/Cd) transporter
MARQRLFLPVALIGLTLLYNVFEGVVAVLSGIEAHSLTLLAFGADSYLEVLAAAAVLWRLSYRDEEEGERAEERAMRLIGLTFLLLAAAITLEATVSLAGGRSAAASGLGILLLAASVTLMPLLSVGKLWLAARTKVAVLAAEAKETVACSYLSLTALVGLVAVALFGWWWLDLVTALLLVPWLVKEGLEGIRAEACFEGVTPCFCRECFFGLRTCRADCCLPALA